MVAFIERSNISQAVLDAVTDSVTVVDRDLKIRYQNEYNRRFFGSRKGAYCYAAFRGRTAPCEDCNVLEVMRDGQGRRAIHDIRLPGGETVLMEVSAAPLRAADGGIVGAVEVARDVTVQKKAEALLSKSLQEKDETLRHYVKELNDAAGYVKTMLPAKLTSGPVTTDWLFLPSAALGGDCFGYHWIDANHFAVYLIDVSGHGWEAALLSVSIINVLRAQTLPDTDFCKPAQVLFNLNNTFPGELHNDLFFSIWYGVYDMPAGALNYAAGGHPPAVLISKSVADDPEITLCRTANFVLGGQRDKPYMEDVVTVERPASLYVFSDGIYEFPTRNRASWGFDAFRQFLAAAAANEWPSLTDILENAQRISPTAVFEDDFTLLQVIFP